MRIGLLGCLVASVTGMAMVGSAWAEELSPEMSAVLEAVYKNHPDKAALCAKGADGWKEALTGPAMKNSGGGRNRGDKIRDLVRDGISHIAKDCGGGK